MGADEEFWPDDALVQSVTAQVLPGILKQIRRELRVSIAASVEVWNREEGRPNAGALTLLSRSKAAHHLRIAMRLRFRRNPWRIAFFCQGRFIEPSQSIFHTGFTVSGRIDGTDPTQLRAVYHTWVLEKDEPHWREWAHH